MFGKIFIAIIICLDYSNCMNLCGDWTQFKDSKCIKVLEKTGTEEEALNICTKLDQSSTLLTIKSKDEQDYFNTLLEKYHNISLNIWLGMKYSDKAFRWIGDGTVIDYNNWSDDSIKDGNIPCVEMSLQKESIGKWSVVSCNKIALIVCQRKSKLDLITVKMALDNVTNLVENLTKVIEYQEKEIKTHKNDFTQELSKQQKAYEDRFSKQQNQINSLIPIGFLYTQLPNQSSPQELWPNIKWAEVTKEYSGLFFRAEGGNSELFGQIQPANQSTISDVYFYGCYNNALKSGICEGEYTSLNRERWTEVVSEVKGWPGALGHLKFYTSSGEVRPKNTAIKIFKRIQ